MKTLMTFKTQRDKAKTANFKKIQDQVNIREIKKNTEKLIVI